VLAFLDVAKSGLLMGFFLPGDSLLLFARLLASSAAVEQFGELPIALEYLKHRRRTAADTPL